jgi:hypothetical protein
LRAGFFLHSGCDYNCLGLKVVLTKLVRFLGKAYAKYCFQ